MNRCSFVRSALIPSRRYETSVVVRDTSFPFSDLGVSAFDTLFVSHLIKYGNSSARDGSLLSVARAPCLAVSEEESLLLDEGAWCFGVPAEEAEDSSRITEVREGLGTRHSVIRVKRSCISCDRCAFASIFWFAALLLMVATPATLTGREAEISPSI